MRLDALPIVMTGLALSGAPASAPAKCKVDVMAELPVTMTRSMPMVSAKINGAEAQLLLDSGAFYSWLTPGAAAQFKLRPEPDEPDIRMEGVGGESRAWLTTVRTLTLLNVPIPNVQFLVAGNELEGAAGVLGQNLLSLGDVEYDLANGAIRLMRPHDCGKAAMVYWAGSNPWSVVDLDLSTEQFPQTTGIAYLTRAKIHVMFDTGATASILTLRAAARAGVKPDQEGVIPAGGSEGIGRHVVTTWIAHFSSFRIGDEEIQNARLRFGDIGLSDSDMLVGADFFLSHRLYVARGQHKLYFTYNGGPVFNLTASASAAASAAPRDESSRPGLGADKPTDAAGFSRRGSASLSRQDYEHAIEDLNRACELAPTEAQYFYQRGLAHWENRQTDLARADFDQAIKLKPDDVMTLLARAELRLRGPDSNDAVADLDTAERIAPLQADARMQIGHLYVEARRFPQAIAQYDKWIGAHDQDVQVPDARNARCWARALWGQELDKALADCNAALRARGNTGAFLDSRGLVRLRMGDPDKSIADYDASLKLEPRNAWSLYGRGLARLRKGMSTEGEADIAAATAIDPHIENEAKKYDLTR